MEENQAKGPGIFYAVVGVATLVVAIIGATFAFFSASVTPANGSDNITGSTQSINTAALTLTVNKVVFKDAVATSPTVLVPAYFGKTNDTLNVANPSNLTDAQIGTMLSNNCEKDGFTGCHVYRIKISSTEDAAHTNLLLNLELYGNPTDKSQWGYAVFKANETMDTTENTKTASLTLAASNPLNAAGHGAPDKIYDVSGTGHNSTSGYVESMDIHNNEGLTAGSEVTYYLLVYVNDTDVSQNTEGANYVVGGYNGSLELQVLGGKVRATFESAAAPTNP